MKWIVRIVSEEAFQGLVTSYVGPFDTEREAAQYVSDMEKLHADALTELYVEQLYDLPPL